MQARLKLWAHIGLFAGVAALAGASYTVASRELVNPDPLVYGLAAKRLLAGQRLYVDFFESKPPLPTLFYTLPVALRPGSYLAISLLLPVVLLVQAAMWIGVARPRPVTAATCLLFIVLYPVTFADFSWTSSEHFANLFVTIMLLVAWGIHRSDRIRIWECLAAGVAAALAFHCRQNTVLAALVPTLAIAATRTGAAARFRAAGWMALGGAVGWGAILALVTWISDLDSYFFQVFEFPRRFAAAGGNAQRYMLASDMAATSLYAILGLTAGIGLVGRHRRLVLMAIPFGLAYCVISPRAHHHYWVNLFPFMVLALMAGLPGEDVRTRVLERVALATVGFCVAGGMLPLVSLAMTPRQTDPLDKVAAWIDSHSRPGDTLYVYGRDLGEYVQFRSRLLPTNKHTVGWEIDWNHGMMEDGFEAILRSYLERPPTWFVVQEPEMEIIKSVAAGSSAEVKPSERLGAALLTQHRYQLLTTLNGHYIHVLRGVAP